MLNRLEPDRSEPVTLALVGAGNRGGDVYAGCLAVTPRVARFVAAAEPDTERRERFAEQRAIPAEMRFGSWQELMAGGRLATGMIIATPDQQHVAPARAALELGYEILLEKPIAPDLEGVLELAAAARVAPGRITVAHVLRYSAFFSAIKEATGRWPHRRPDNRSAHREHWVLALRALLRPRQLAARGGRQSDDPSQGLP